MPSRQLTTSPPSTFPVDPYPPPQPPNPNHHHHLLTPLLTSTASACSFFLLLLLCLRRNTRKRTTPSSDSDSNPPHPFSYSHLRRATNSFATRLGHGGFGPVFSGSLPPAGKPVAVKLMDSASLQGEREFHNELFFASRLRSHHVLPPMGFSSDPKRRRFLLVYDLMHNGNLHDALLRRKCPEVMEWKKRFAVALDVARGIQYLHSCDPPVIHGDIKPSNILLDSCLSAKIGDFGLARLKSESPFEVGVLGGVDGVGKRDGGLDLDDSKIKEELESDDCGSLVEETESVNTGFGVEQSPEGFVRIAISDSSPETMEAVTAETGLAVAGASPSVVNFEKASIQSENDIVGGVKNGNGEVLNSNSVRDWWWKQDNEVAATASAPVAGNKKVKDYVMDWIGKEVNKESAKSEWVGATSSSGTMMGKTEKKKSRKKLEWWESMDEEKDAAGILKKEKRRPVREWWKEEYSEELAKKKKKKKKQQKGKGANSDDNGDDWWVRDDALYGDIKKTKKGSRKSRGSVDWWLDGISGDLRRARRNSYDSASGEIPKSGGISSTPSMRGTVFYVAPEYGYSGDVSEKCDVYSFGVLLLVIISGRRPLQVTGSPLSEFQRANLLSWARHCARNGKLLELVDQSIQSLDKEQALLCITVALLCLLKSPARRPSMEEVVGMLSGELEPPQLPVEYSPSPPSRFPFKSRKEGH